LEAVESGKLVIAVVHWKARDKIIEALKKREDAEIFNVTFENRGELHKTVVQKAQEFLNGKRER
jgi:nucleoside-triphosphatase THEP1